MRDNLIIPLWVSEMGLFVNMNAPVGISLHARTDIVTQIQVFCEDL